MNFSFLTLFVNMAHIKSISKQPLVSPFLDSIFSRLKFKKLSMFTPFTFVLSVNIVLTSHIQCVS